MRTIIVILLLGLLSNNCYSQDAIFIPGSSKSNTDKGDYYFKQKDYKRAIVYYNMAYKKDARNYYSVLRKAEAYTKLNLLPQAAECYRIAFDNDSKIENVYRLQYALVLLKNNDSEGFKKWFKKYNQFVEEDIKGQNYISSMENRVKLYKDSTLKIVSNVPESELSGSDDFNSFKAGKLKLAGVTTTPSVTIPGFNYSIENPSLNSLGTVMYFSSITPKGKGGKDIYISRLENNTWSQPTNLGDVINSSGDETYPYIHNDSILYFSSNGHKGFGGMDIYSVNIKYADKKVVNLGKEVNTKGDDFGIFVIPDGQTGYFSSDGLKEGTGIYKVKLIDFKIKYAAYRPRIRTSLEKDKVNLAFSNGEEYNIEPDAKGNYTFTFLPNENYKIIIQQVNIEATDVLMNKGLTPKQRSSGFMDPPPVQEADLIIPYGLKYEFSAGQSTLTDQYLNELNAKVKEFQTPNENTISLTALAKDMQFKEGEIYKVIFKMDEKAYDRFKGKDQTTLIANNRHINLNGESFYILLPLSDEAKFNLLTDLNYLGENYSSKKYALYVDDKPLFKDAVENSLSLTVNTKSINDVKQDNYFAAKEIAIIPGTEYILTLSKFDEETGEDIEIIVPLTKGVKYNLTSSDIPTDEHKAALAEMLIGRQGVELANEEVIDLSLLSKELEIQSGEQLAFHLLPAKKFGNQSSSNHDKKSTLHLDGSVIEISNSEKYTINVPLSLSNKFHIQTDIDYVKENFNPNEYTVRLDTTSFLAEIPVDTTGYNELKSTGWLVSLSVNTDSIEEVELRNQLIAEEVSIIPGKEYILTVSKVDFQTKEEDEIIVPLTRKIKYDFTSNPVSEEAYRESLERFIAGQEDIETIDGEIIDINILSKALQIKEGDEVSFSLLPVKDLNKKKGAPEAMVKSSLYLDNKIVEFTHIQKYTINVPLKQQGKMNLHTDIEHIQENFTPGTFTLDIDTISFFSEITVDTTGYGDRVMKEEDIIDDPVFDVVVINFDLDEHKLRPDAIQTIQGKVIDELKGDKRLYVTIKGYTDGLGDADYNFNLSKNRAESVKDFLTKNGIGDNRIRTFSFGESKALKQGVKWEDLSEEELEKHRKVEIVIYLPD